MNPEKFFVSYISELVLVPFMINVTKVQYWVWVQHVIWCGEEILRTHPQKLSISIEGQHPPLRLDWIQWWEVWVQIEWDLWDRRISASFCLGPIWENEYGIFVVLHWTISVLAISSSSSGLGRSCKCNLSYLKSWWHLSMVYEFFFWFGFDLHCWVNVSKVDPLDSLTDSFISYSELIMFPSLLELLTDESSIIWLLVKSLFCELEQMSFFGKEEKLMSESWCSSMIWLFDKSLLSELDQMSLFEKGEKSMSESWYSSMIYLIIIIMWIPSLGYLWK